MCCNNRRPPNCGCDRGHNSHPVIRRRFSCPGTQRIIRHEHIVNHQHDIINEFDVIHEHDINQFDVVRERNVVRHHDNRTHDSSNYCNRNRIGSGNGSRMDDEGEDDFETIDFGRARNTGRNRCR